MDPIFRKLNYKNQKEIHVINAPDSFIPHLNKMRPLCSIKAGMEEGQVSFVLIFVSRRDEIRQHTQQLNQVLGKDPVVWFAYPKKSSRKFTSDIHRDSGWEPMGSLGYEPVRQIAIDEDWSALRFRNVAFIKKMDRNPERMISRGRKTNPGKI